MNPQDARLARLKKNHQDLLVKELIGHILLPKSDGSIYFTLGEFEDSRDYTNTLVYLRDFSAHYGWDIEILPHFLGGNDISPLPTYETYIEVTLKEKK